MVSKKISQFNVSTSLNTSDLFTFVVNGTNKSIAFSDFKTSLGVTGTINQTGDPLGVPVLEKCGDANNIRNMESSNGIRFSVSADNGVMAGCNFIQDATGANIIENLNSDQYKFKSIVGGAGITITTDGDTITIGLS